MTTTTQPIEFMKDGLHIRIALDDKIMRFEVTCKLAPEEHTEALYTLDSLVIIARPFTRLTNVWGCDGVGEIIERRNGRAFRYLSTMGPRNYGKALDAIARDAVSDKNGHRYSTLGDLDPIAPGYEA